MPLEHAAQPVRDRDAAERRMDERRSRRIRRFGQLGIKDADPEPFAPLLVELCCFLVGDRSRPPVVETSRPKKLPVGRGEWFELQRVFPPRFVRPRPLRHAAVPASPVPSRSRAAGREGAPGRRRAILGGHRALPTCLLPRREEAIDGGAARPREAGTGLRRPASAPAAICFVSLLRVAKHRVPVVANGLGGELVDCETDHFFETDAPGGGVHLR
jgi:hypothetical protein